MTTSAEEVLGRIRESNRVPYIDEADNPQETSLNPDVPKLLSALQAVLAMPQRTEDSPDRAKVLIDYGYNQCLADVQAIIEGKVTG